MRMPCVVTFDSATLSVPPKVFSGFAGGPGRFPLPSAPELSILGVQTQSSTGRDGQSRPIEGERAVMAETIGYRMAIMDLDWQARPR
jgi:hypothetical protein